MVSSLFFQRQPHHQQQQQQSQRLLNRNTRSVKFRPHHLISLAFVAILLLLFRTSALLRNRLSSSITNDGSSSSGWLSFAPPQATTTTAQKPFQTKPQLRLRFDYTRLEAQTSIAKLMKSHQTNCSLPVGNFMWRKKIFGLGSDVHVWGAALCNAMEEGVRIRTYHHEDEWVWLDQEKCDMEEAKRSALSCYFPHAELQCPQDFHDASLGEPSSRIDLHNVSNPIKVKCDSIMPHYNKSDWRAAGAEHLFTHISPLVQQEGERQLNLVFSEDSAVPANLITVHVRWGDKKFENKVYGIRKYIAAIEEIKQMRNDPPDAVTNVFLATEDPEAVKAFEEETADSNYRLYLDQMYHDMLPYRPVDPQMYNKVPHTSRKLKGRVGLWSLGSLLVAMEANAFVLTRTSNWSRLMDELRKTILNPRCRNCTLMVDLSKDDPKFKEW